MMRRIYLGPWTCSQLLIPSRIIHEEDGNDGGEKHIEIDNFMATGIHHSFRLFGFTRPDPNFLGAIVSNSED
jgi:hypothetical protein